MKSTDIIYDRVINGEDSYFYGANSKDGFRPTPDRTDETSCRAAIYIKGGPGTGKSTLMRRFAFAAGKIGYDLKYYYCSSDPSSLDGVVAYRADECVAVFDATSPHSSDPAYPGAVSSTFDLSQFWQGEALARERETIIGLSDEKKDCFDRAYACLKAASEVSAALLSLASDCTDKEKLSRFAKRIAARHKSGGRSRRVITSSVSMKGAVRLETLREKAKTVYTVSDPFGISQLAIDEIAKALSSSGVGFITAESPLDGAAEELLVEGDGTLYTLFPGGAGINAERFASPDAARHRARYRFLKKCRIALVDEALLYLSSASAPHFSLEKLFSSAMDFDAATESFDRRVISLL